MTGPSDFARQIDDYPFVLTEAAVIEVLRRTQGIALHPLLENALLLYSAAGRRVLTTLYRTYLDIARRAGVPILLCAPTWRANRRRLTDAGVEADVNGDAVQFMRTVIDTPGEGSAPVWIGGLIGCRNDSYRPEQGLDPVRAATFHRWQIEHLCRAGVDFVLAATLPALPEALGIARAMQGLSLPYLLSFVIDRRGRLLDGNSLSAAVRRIDTACRRPPLGYMVNCAYPSFLEAVEPSPTLAGRLIGFQANASSLDHDQLDGSAALKADPLRDWGERMFGLRRRWGLKIMGGCCGTDASYLRYLAAHRDG